MNCCSHLFEIGEVTPKTPNGEMSGTMNSSSTSCFIVRSPPGCTRSGGFCTSLTRTMGATLSLKVEDILNKFSRNKRCNGLNSVVRIQAHSTTVCKLLKRLVPGAGFEPAPSYEERILRLSISK